MHSSEETDSSTTKPSKATVYIEWTLLVTNIVLLCFAWTILGVAAAFIAEEEFGILLQTDLGFKNYVNGCRTSLAIGVVLVVTSGLQFFGYACTKEGIHRWIRGVSLGLMLVIAVLEVTSLAWLFGTHDKDLEEKLLDLLGDTMINDHLRGIMDQLQIRLQCCGAKSITDFGKNIPLSCHPKGQVFEKGCADVFGKYVLKRTDVLEGLLCMTILLEVTWCVATLWSCHIERKSRAKGAARQSVPVHFRPHEETKQDTAIKRPYTEYATVTEVILDVQNFKEAKPEANINDEVNQTHPPPSAPPYASIDRRTKTRGRSNQEDDTLPKRGAERPESHIYAVLEPQEEPVVPPKMLSQEQQSYSVTTSQQPYHEAYESDTVLL